MDRLRLLFFLGRPLSPLYCGLMRARARAYERGLLASRRLPVPVISVGNLSLGGTGKTPHVLAVARWLKDMGRRPAIVSRGYGGKAGRGPLVVADGQGVKATVRQAGDEPLMMAQGLPGVPVVVGSDRFSAGRLAVERLCADVIVLDDGFQHGALARDIDIVLLPAQAPFGTGRVFPGGDLREPLSALERATALVLSKAEALSPADRELLRARIQRAVPGKPVFVSENLASRLITLGGESVPVVPEARSLPLVAFCGLARPEGFFETLSAMGLSPVAHRVFPDHHAYTGKDVDDLFTLATSAGAHALVTTAKDRVKLEPLLGRGGAKDLPIWVLEIEARPEDGLRRLIEARLAAGSRAQAQRRTKMR